MNRKTFFLTPLGLLLFNMCFLFSFSQSETFLSASDSLNSKRINGMFATKNSNEDVLIVKLIEETLELEQVIDSIKSVNEPLVDKPVEAYTEEDIIIISINNQIISACEEEMRKNSKLIQYKLKDRSRRRKGK